MMKAWARGITILWALGTAPAAMAQTPWAPLGGAAAQSEALRIMRAAGMAVAFEYRGDSVLTRLPLLSTMHCDGFRSCGALSEADRAELVEAFRAGANGVVVPHERIATGATIVLVGAPHVHLRADTVEVILYIQSGLRPYVGQQANLYYLLRQPGGEVSLVRTQYRILN